MADDPQDLLRLADEVAATTGPDREIDIAIVEALGWRHTVTRFFGEEYWERGSLRIYRSQLPKPTALIDHAISLVPEGLDWMVDNFDGSHDRRCSASVFEAPGREYADYEAYAATPALALCAAALKARAHSTKESDNG